MVGQLSKSSHRFSKGELKEGSKDKDTSTVVHCDSLHTEKKLTEEEQKKLEAEHESKLYCYKCGRVCVSFYYD